MAYFLSENLVLHRLMVMECFDGDSNVHHEGSSIGSGVGIGVCSGGCGVDGVVISGGGDGRTQRLILKRCTLKR